MWISNLSYLFRYLLLIEDHRQRCCHSLSGQMLEKGLSVDGGLRTISAQFAIIFTTRDARNFGIFRGAQGF
jgi:hypothetical protein